MEIIKNQPLLTHNFTNLFENHLTHSKLIIENIPYKRRNLSAWMRRGIIAIFILSFSVWCLVFIPHLSKQHRNLIAFGALAIMPTAIPLFLTYARYMQLNIALVYKKIFQKDCTHIFLKGARIKAGSRTIWTNIAEFWKTPFAESKSDLPEVQIETFHKIITTNNIPIDREWIKTMLEYIYNEEKLSQINTEYIKVILAIIGIIFSCILVKNEMGAPNVLLSLFLAIWLVNYAQQQLSYKKEFTSKRKTLQQMTRLLNNYQIKYL